MLKQIGKNFTDGSVKLSASVR